MAFPNPVTVSFFWERKLDDKTQPPSERLIHIGTEICREDRNAFVLFHLLQQVANFDVRIAVVGVVDFGALATKSIGFVEMQNCIGLFRSIENSVQVFLSFSDVLTDDSGKIDLVEVQ